jgi:hypothetical protein
MACSFVFGGLPTIDARCHLGIFEHILDKVCKYIFFEHKDKVYFISKQLIVDVFGVCVEGYVEDPKGQVSKSLAVHTLQNCRLAPTNSFAY